MEIDNSIPDYFAGRLIYYDGISAETMRWIVYDGHRKVRFTTRAAAEKFAAEEAAKSENDFMERLFLANLYADKARKALDAAATFAPENLKQTIEKLALGIRKANDLIDKITALSWKPNKP